MALGTFDRVIVSCSCRSGEIDGAEIYNGDHTVSANLVLFLPYADMVNDDNENRQEVIDAVVDGDCAVYLRDGTNYFGYLNLPSGTDPSVPPEIQRLQSTHPFHITAGWKAQEAFTNHGDVDEDSGTGKPSVTMRGDIATENRVPDSDTFAAGLDEWVLFAVGSDYFNLELGFDLADEWTLTNLDEHEQIKALGQFLRNHTTNGDQISDSLAVRSLTQYRNRDYEFEQSTGSTIKVRIVPEDDEAYASTSGGFLFGYGFRVVVQDDSPNAYDDDDLRQLLMDTTVTVSTDGLPLQRGQMGGNQTIMRMKRAYIGTDEEWIERDTGGRYVKVYGNHRIPIESGYGLEQDLISMAIPTGETYRQLPTFRDFDTIHMDGATLDYDLQLVSPSDFVGQKGLHRRFVVHNRDDEFDIKLRDWDDEVFLRIYPTERVEFQMTQGFNSGGELVTLGSPPTRHLDFSTVHSSGVSLNSQPRLDVTSPSDGSVRTLPVPSSVNDYEFYHEDYFERGTGAFTNGLAIQSQTSETNVFKAGAWKITGQTDGFIRFDVSLILEISETGTGSESGVEMVLFRFRDDEVDAVARIPHPDLDPSSSLRSAYTLAYRGRVEQDDIFIPGIYYDDGGTLGVTNISFIATQVEIEVQPQIKLDYS